MTTRSQDTCPTADAADGSLVGTDALLQDSANVKQPITVNAPIPVPSIYKDGRGQIHNLLMGDKRINILYTKKGVMRSGDIHRNTQHDFVFSGQVRVWMLQKDGTAEKKMYGPYEYICVPPLVPHIFEFLEPTVMAEWWEPEPFQAWFYEPYRQLVEKSFVSTDKGKLIKLTEDNRGSYGSFVLLSTALGLGIVVGLMIGRRKT